MNNFKQEFMDYKKACYPPAGQIGNPVQEKEVTQAFYAGAFGAMNVLIDAMGKDPLTVDSMAKDLYAELATVLNPANEQSFNG